MNVKKIVIKSYQEFTEEVDLTGEGVEHFMVVREVEAVIQTEEDEFFSLGFSVNRESKYWNIDSPREMVRRFISDKFK